MHIAVIMPRCHRDGYGYWIRREGSMEGLCILEAGADDGEDRKECDAAPLPRIADTRPCDSSRKRTRPVACRAYQIRTHGCTNGCNGDSNCDSRQTSLSSGASRKNAA